MWKKLRGGIKLDPMQPKLSTNSRRFRPMRRAYPVSEIKRDGFRISAFMRLYFLSASTCQR